MNSIAFVVGFALLSVSLAASSRYVVVPTTEGPIRGLRGTHVHKFLGVPFAKPPVGSLRFAPPQTLSKRSGTRDATTYGNACMQVDSPIPISEDCLYLNIFQPVGAKNAATLLWVHGGSLTSGTGASYDGSYIANHTNMIVVTINYRLGAFGFLALNQTLARDGTTGNYGLQDQRAALKWVRSNIKHFNGKTSKITLAGESAGAFSVCTHLAAPLSRDLYRAVIMESTYQNCDALPLATAEAASAAVVTGTGCNGTASVLNCLQSASADDILDISSDGITWKPTIDGYELTKQPFEYIANGSYSKVPVLLGTNQDEAAYLICGVQPFQSFTEVQLRAFIASVFGSYVGGLIDNLYNISSYPAPFRAQIAIESDYLFKCPTKRLAGMIDATVPVWMYSFNYVSRGKCGAAHATELPYIFPSASYIIGANYTFNAQEMQLSREMTTYWTNFVENLNPHYKSEQIAWPKYTEPVEQFLNFNLTLSLGDHFRSNYCPFWNAITPL